jgi:flagellar biosynthesis/type III secretory pathway M-ring protein FliF/YscJ
MKKFRSVPAIITLLAGFVTCVLMIKNKITIVQYLWTLALVMVGFYICGVVVRFILNKVFEDKKEDEHPEGEEALEGEEGAEEETPENTDVKDNQKDNQKNNQKDNQKDNKNQKQKQKQGE